MDILKEFFLQIVSPMLWLLAYAFALTLAGTQLIKQWGKSNFTGRWLSLWVTLFILMLTFNKFRS